MTLWWNIKHQFFDWMMIVGLRDRLRCPQCKAVGTWKPHGGWMDWEDRRGRKHRRWLCKWCGYYEGMEGKGHLCYPSKLKGCWAFFSDPYAKDDRDQRVPEEIRLREFPNVWPWRG
jgi:hypothetical protein